MFFPNSHQGRKLPAAAPGLNETDRRDLTALMYDRRTCTNGHDEVGWQGTPSSACWVCDRPWTTP